MSLLHTCSTPTTTLPSTWEDETLALYVAFRESNNPISITVASAFDEIVKLTKAGGGGSGSSGLPLTLPFTLES